LSSKQRLVVETSDPCNIAAANVRNLASDSQLGPIHRFLRLWRKLGWDMLDMDRCLHAFGATDIDDTLLTKLSDAQRLADRLTLSVVKLLPLWAPLDTFRYGDELDPYRALFQNKAVTNPIDPCFALTVPPANPELAGGAGCTMTVSAHLPAIQSALRLSAPNVVALAASVLPDDTLKLANLSALCRHALLARALRLSVPDLLSLKALHNADPFVSPRATLEFVNFADAVRNAGFTIGQLDHLYRDLPPASGSLALTARQLAELVAGLEDGLAHIAADNVPTTDPAGELTRKKLMAIYDAPIAEAIVSLIQGTSVWRAPLSAMPSLAVADELRVKLYYAAEAGTLQFSGAMTVAERNALVTGQPPSFQTAVQSLWQQPQTFIDTTLAHFPVSATDSSPKPFLDPTAAKATLLDRTITNVKPRFGDAHPRRCVQDRYGPSSLAAGFGPAFQG
jgi:hypothetical protein